MHLPLSEAAEARREGVWWGRGRAGRVGRGGWEDYSSRRALRRRGSAEIKLQAPSARDPAVDPGAGVTVLRCLRGGCSWSLRRAQPAASLCSARPFGAFPAAGALPPTAPQKGGRTRPNRAARVRGSINCKWTAGVLDTSKLGLEEASEVITQGPER